MATDMSIFFDQRVIPKDKLKTAMTKAATLNPGRVVRLDSSRRTPQYAAYGQSVTDNVVSPAIQAAKNAYAVGDLTHAQYQDAVMAAQSNGNTALALFPANQRWLDPAVVPVKHSGVGLDYTDTSKVVVIDLPRSASW